MRIGLVGGSYEEWSKPFDAQRTVNLYPTVDPQGKETSALYGTPGLKLFASVSNEPVRGIFSTSSGKVFAVIGATLYEISGSGSYTNRGTLLISTGNITIDENGFQLAVCDGTYLYMYTYADNTFQKVSDPDFPQAVGTVCFADGYFIVNEVNTGKFYISGLYDGLSWDALDYATAEADPDNLVRIYSAIGQIWLLGKESTEPWQNTGDAEFPYQRIPGINIPVGCASPYSLAKAANTLFWVGRDKLGLGCVYMARGFAPQRISNDPIDRILQDINNIEGINGWIYQEQGHIFYVLTGGGLSTTLVYDINTQIWHERAYLNEYGQYEQHLAYCHCLGFNKHLVGDRTTGKIYEMSMSFYDDDGRPIKRERTFTHIVDEGKYLRYNRLELGFETGVGDTYDTSQGYDPEISLSLSKDGARTWSIPYTTKIGKLGKYLTRVRFRRLGLAYQMTFKVTISDPVKVAITGAYLV